MGRQKNLLYIFADQWRAQGVGYMKQDEVKTPNIDTFAKESMIFTNAISTYPLCSPHRASLMTGKYPYQAGIWTNCKIGLDEIVMLKPQETCIGNVLKENGYQTGYIGKWHLDGAEKNFNKHPKSGATDWDAYTPPGERRQGFDYWLSYGADDNHMTPHYWENTKDQIHVDKWSVEYETDKTIEFLEKRKDSDYPFALFLSYNPPHLPYHLVPDRYYNIYKEAPVHFRENVPKEIQTEELKIITRQYFAAITGIDEQFARINEYLKKNHLEENTLLVLSSDHGEMLGSHNRMSKNIWYEEAIHIPLMLRLKGVIKQGINHSIFASPDHMPTLLDLLNLPVPDTCQGYSHKKGIIDKDDSAPKQAFICSFPGMPDMVEQFRLQGLNSKAYGFRGVRTQNHTYVINNGYTPGFKQIRLLYDNKNDPYQLNALRIQKSDPSAFIQELNQSIKEYLTLTNDPFLF